MADRNIYDDLVQQDTAQALRTSMAGVVDRQPDVEAKLQSLARDYQMPVDAVRLRQPEIERKARLDALDYDTLAREYPKTATTLADPAKASVAHDDVDNMSLLERGLRQLVGGAVEGTGMAVSGMGVGLDILQRNILGAITDMLPTPRGGPMTPEARDSAIGPLLGQDFRLAGGMVKRAARDDIKIPASQQAFGDKVVAGVGQVGGQIAMAPLIGPAGLYFQGLDVMDEKVGKDNASQGAKDLATVGGAVVTGITEKWALDRLLGPVADPLKTGLRGALTRIGVAGVSEGAQEFTENLLQDIIRQQITNPDATPDLMQSLDEGSVGAAVGVVVRGMVEGALRVRARGIRTEQDAQQAEAHAQVLGELATLAEASKVRERDPASFATFMQSLTEDGVPNVYVDAKTLVDSLDINEVAMVLPSVAEQIAQAAATGGDVVIPTAELLTAGPGQSFMQTLLDNARTAPEAMSPVEAREYMQTKGDQLNADIQVVLEKQEQDQTWRQMRDELRDEFKAQLDGVKRFTGDVNRQYANLLANFYSVTAAKLGQTPQELATRYGLRVQSRGVEGGQVLDQGDVSVTADEDGGTVYAITAHDEGRAFVSAEANPDGTFSITESGVPEDERGQGLGVRMYDALLRDAFGRGAPAVTSDQSVSADAQRVYRALEKRGYKVEQNPAATVDPDTGALESADGPVFRVLPGKVLQQEIPQQPRLMAVHNLSADNLLFADKMGGLAVPSIGVVGQDFGGVEGFGEITLLGRKDLVDPARERVFSSDAYTARFPKPEWPKAKTKDAQELADFVRAAGKEFGDPSIKDETFDNMVNTPDASRVVEKWLTSSATKALFLREQGVDVQPVTSARRFQTYLTEQDLVELRPLYDIVNEQQNASQYDTPEQQQLRDEIVQRLRAQLEGRDANERTKKVAEDNAQRVAQQAVNLLYRDYRTLAEPVPVNTWETSAKLDELIAPRAVEFKQWVESKVLPKFGDPFIKVGRTKAPYTLDNIVEVMTDTKVKGKEKTMTYGAGQVRAASSVEFSDLEQMRAAAENAIVDPEQYEAAKKETEQKLDAYRSAVVGFTKATDWRGNPDTWEAMDASMRALAKWATGKKRDAAAMKAALRAENFDVAKVPAEVIQQAIEAAESLLQAPVPYFEAKPQRAVSLGEFAGAVIPADAPQAVRDVLAKNGVAVTEYAPGTDRTAVVRQFAAQLADQGQATLFQSAPLPDTIEIDGKQRPTTNSNGQPIAQTEEGVRNFWAWFGDSKVVDDQGRPLVVYHSTLDDKVQFDKAGKFMGYTGVSGISATDNPEMASRYLDRFGALRYDGKAFEKNVMPLYVKAENPLERDEPFKTNLRLGAPLPDGYVSEVEKMGHDALIRNDAISRKGTVKHSDAKNAIRGREIVVFDPTQIKSAIGNDGTFDPQNPSILRQEARGSINLPDDPTRSPAIISLFEGADLSTFLHESGHFFLEVQMDLAARIQAQIDAGATVSEGEQSIVNDANTLLAWFGVKGSETTSPLTEWFSLDLETKRPYHEQFARGFEAYAFEGNAPSIELQGMFQKFRAWLLAVYKELRALRVELTDDVRGVMDRMLASTDAIQEAEAARRLGPLFKTAEDAGMSLDEFKAYHALATDASQAAIEELQARGLRDMKWLQGAKDRKLKEMQKLHDSLRREVRAEVRREVMSQPVYRAWQFLTGKGAADETAQPADKPKASKDLDVINDDLLTAVAKLGGLRKDQAVSQWGVDPKQKVESGVFGTPVMRANGGLDLDTMGERLVEAGYLTPDENGKHDPREFEEKFDAAIRGESIYSAWHEYQRPDDGAPVQKLPEGIAFGKLDTAEMQRRYGAQPDAPWRKLQAARMTSTSRGLHPDVVAEATGFESGDQMVKALLDAEAPQSVIEGMTDQRMLERFGDLGTPQGLQRAVDRAIHNEVRARFLSTEIAALERGMRVREETGTNAQGRRTTVDVMTQVAKQQAARIVGGTKVKNLRPSQYTAAETRAAKAAERALLAGKTEDALAEKRHQLINLHAAREATRAQEDVEKIATYLRKFGDKPKGLDADYYDQIAQLLERFDLARSTTLKDIAKRKTLAAWVESQREQGLEPEIPPELLDEARRTSYKDLTVDELRGLRDTVRQIEKLGRLKNTLLTAKQLRDFQAVRDLITDSILANADGRTADTRTPATRSGRWFKAVKDFGAAHIKAATWARVFDGGKDGGPVWEYFIRPANEAADMETRMRAEATEKLHAILAPVIKAGRMDGKGRFFATINRSMNREQVFAMALNMGNEGNLQRMLDGEGWTIQQIQPVVATLSSSDWLAVQAVWDHFESYRPLIGAKERRIYGKEPAWVEPMPLSVQAADGVVVPLRGGYYPVKYDPLANNKAEQHADAEDAKRQMQAAYTSATTRRGFTKSRAEAVKGRPLLYSLSAIYSGTQDVIHDLAFHEWLIDTNKLLRSDKINAAIRETYGPAAVRQLKTWIEDTARGEQGLQAELDSMLGRLRQGVSIAGLGFNVMSAAIQPIGLTQSVVRVGGKWIGRGVAQYLSNPLGKAREVNARSEFMAARARTRFRELNELRNQVEGEHPARTWIANGAFYFMTRMQMVVDVPTWLGAYEKAISEGNTDERAGQLADQAVIDAQGGGQVKDLSAIERGGPAQKLFTVFYSFMNTALNVGVTQTMTEKNKAKLAADYLLLYSVPAVLTVALKDALTPGDSGDWEDLDKLLRKLMEAQLDMLFGLMVGVRELAGAAKMALGLTEYAQDYQGPAGLRLLSDITGLGEQIGQGELDDSFRKRAINVLGSAFGLPAAQANRTITGTQALLEGETVNPAAIAFGYQEP